MIKLISRSGTLFSIIDGKEIQCKDQEQAYASITSTNQMIMKDTIQNDLVYSVPGYTVGLDCGNRNDCGCLSVASGCVDLVSILSLEAPENSDDHYVPPQYTSSKKFKVVGEQPAQPVDKPKHPDFPEWIKSKEGQECSRFDTLTHERFLTNRLFWAFDAGRNRIWDQYVSIKSELEKLKSVSLFPERGESDDYLNYMEKQLIDYTNIRDCYKVDTQLWGMYDLMVRQYTKDIKIYKSKPPKQ